MESFSVDDLNVTRAFLQNLLKTQTFHINPITRVGSLFNRRWLSLDVNRTCLYVKIELDSYLYILWLSPS